VEPWTAFKISLKTRKGTRILQIEQKKLQKIQGIVQHSSYDQID